jgi:hypothetical protein
MMKNQLTIKKIYEKRVLFGFLVEFLQKKAPDSFDLCYIRIRTHNSILDMSTISLLLARNSFDPF